MNHATEMSCAMYHRMCFLSGWHRMCFAIRMRVDVVIRSKDDSG